jgi:hypothetical protein
MKFCSGIFREEVRKFLNDYGKYLCQILKFKEIVFFITFHWYAKFFWWVDALYSGCCKLLRPYCKLSKARFARFAPPALKVKTEVPPIKLHGVKSQKTVIFISTALTTSCRIRSSFLLVCCHFSSQHLSPAPLTFAFVTCGSPHHLTAHRKRRAPAHGRFREVLKEGKSNPTLFCFTFHNFLHKSFCLLLIFLCVCHVTHKPDLSFCSA